MLKIAWPEPHLLGIRRNRITIHLIMSYKTNKIGLKKPAIQLKHVGTITYSVPRVI